MIASRVRPLLAAVAIALTTAPARPAMADDRDVATADALFEAARQAVAQGDYAGACPKFAESARLDPAAGAWLNLADCEERLGHLSAAWSAWREGVALLPRDDERLAPARQRAQAIDKRLPRLIVKLSPDSRRGARLRRDGVDLGTASFDLPLPVDPGRHTVQVEASGFAPSSTEVTLAEGETRTIEIAPGTIIPSPAPPPPPTTISTTTPSAAVSTPGIANRDADNPSRRRTLRTAGWIVGGFGIAGLGVGVTTGAMALAKKGTVQAHCQAGQCDPSGFDAAQTGHTLATTSNVGLAAGGVLVAAGLWLVLTNAPRAETKLTVAPAGAGASLAFERTF